MTLVTDFFIHFREFFAGHIIFSIAVLLLSGYFFGVLAEKIKLPAITGYIVAGLIMGESAFDLIHANNTPLLHNLSEVTLSIIALTIGGEFSISKLRLLGKNIIIMTLAQMLLTYFLVAGILIAFNLVPVWIAFVLGAIAAATAPAATVVIVEKLKARGTFVDYLYGIVALDDAGTVILFSLTFAISGGLISSADVSITHTVFHALSEVFFSILAGLVAGFILNQIAKKRKTKNELKIITLGILFLVTAITITLHLSPLIANMTIGMVIVNLSKRNVKIIHALEPIAPPLYATFFAVAGTELSFEIFNNIQLLIAGALFVIFRAIGKYGGIALSARLLKAPNNVKKYLGLALFPQAGVAIGLVLFVQGSPVITKLIAENPDLNSSVVAMVNIVLISVFVNELTGPPISKYAIVKSMKG